jgi:hypothetical protein
MLAGNKLVMDNSAGPENIQAGINNPPGKNCLA